MMQIQPDLVEVVNDSDRFVPVAFCVGARQNTLAIAILKLLTGGSADV